MRIKRVTSIAVLPAILVLAFAAVARSQDAGTLLEGKRELDAVVAAIRAVVPDGLLNFEGRWLCRSTSVDPTCHVNGSVNDSYSVGSFKQGRIFSLLQLATGSSRIHRVGSDKPRARVERPWLLGDSVVITVQIRPGEKASSGDTLTTLHEVVLGMVDGKFATRAVRPLTNPQTPVDSTR